MEGNRRIELLRSLGAADSDMDMLLDYTANTFSPCLPEETNDGFPERWEPVMQSAKRDGAAVAINRHLARAELQIQFASPENLNIELFRSVGGMIPIITARSTADFDNMVRYIVHKGKEVPNIADMGAVFAFGKTSRFIILSCKPYANVPAAHMSMDEEAWAEKSLVIRKHHECAHYFTKRFYSSSKNNLHDELIADFYGLYAAFGEYRAEWFLRFMGLTADTDGISGRFQIYTRGLSSQGLKVIEKLACIAAESVEEWSKTTAFAEMDESDRIRTLCEKELLAHISTL